MFQRYVAIGDSSTEGLDDPDGAGGYRGWADRLAEQVAVTSPGLHYANLAVRGRLAGQVRAEQLPRAVALQPDLATFFAGVNDLLRPRYDQDRVLAEVEHVLAELVSTGATVLTITCADPARTMPIARPLRARVLAYNDGVRRAAARTGALVADVAAAQVASDPRLWSLDRL
ncbi:MAG: lysophospholipase, partial [Frankiales bacterium]|nr:lysophospholipase [Frankiales bacterium]